MPVPTTTSAVCAIQSTCHCKLLDIDEFRVRQCHQPQQLGDRWYLVSARRCQLSDLLSRQHRRSLRKHRHVHFHLRIYCKWIFEERLCANFLVALLVFAWWRRGATERSAEEGTAGEQTKGLATYERMVERGGAGEALMSGPRLLTYRPTFSVRQMESKSMQFLRMRLRVA